MEWSTETPPGVQQKQLFKGEEIFDAYISVLNYLLYIAITISNLLTIICLHRYEFLRRKKNLLIGSLSVADLCVGIGRMIAIVINFLDKRECISLIENFFSTELLMRYPLYTSVIHLIIIAIDRLVAVVLPLRYESLMPTKMLIVLITFAWAFPFFFLFIKLLTGRNGPLTGCDEMYITIMAQTVPDLLIYFSILTMLIGMHGIILKEAHQQSRRILNMETTAGNQVTKHATKANKCVIIILGSFSALYFPFALLNILVISNNNLPVLFHVLQSIGMQCMLLNSFVNIFIYAVWLKDFRKAYKMLFHCGRNDIIYI